MLESRRLKHFLAIYELGSIGQAAEKLLLTQPALSKSIRQLEDELGVRLFERTTMGVVPTTFGNALAMHAKAIEAQVRHAEAQIKRLRGVGKGLIAVGMGPSLASNLMPLATVMLQRVNPEIEMVVTEGLVDDIIPALRRNEIQVAIGAWPEVADPLFTTELITRDVIEVFGAAGHPLAGRKVELRELVDHAWVLPPASQRWRREFEEMFFAQGLSPPKPAVVSNSGAFLKELILHGGFLSFLPRGLVQHSHGIAAIDVDMPRISPTISITYRERSLQDAAVAEFVEVLRTIGATPPPEAAIDEAA